MDINIDSKKLTDSPYGTNNKFAFSFDDDEKVAQIVLELKYGAPSAFLLSGYRGVGKTSFVNRVIESVGDDFVCIHLNLAKYEGYPVLLKKLIRALYLAYETRLVLKQPSEDNREFINEFKLLYDRTFHDIVNTHSLNVKQGLKRATEVEFDMKKIIPLFVVLLSGVNLTFEILGSKGFGFLMLMLSLLWAGVSIFKFNWSKNQEKNNTADISRKSLYDDNIAEHHLMSVLTKIRDQNIKVLVAFDELDKIEEIKDVLTVVNDLKFLLLSGLANFFVISGQALYYSFAGSAFEDDQVISSLFSKSIHIPFLKSSSLKRYCLELINDDSLRKIPLVNSYFDGLILSSNRIPRKLVNLIRSQIQWNNSQAFLRIQEDSYLELENESVLAYAVNRVVDHQLTGITGNNVQLDFYISQIHIWIAKMRLYQDIRFLMSTIIDQKSYEGKVPPHYIAQLWSVGDLLTDELLEQDILKIYHSDDHEVESSYSWVLHNGSHMESMPSYSTGPNAEKSDQIDPQFVLDFAGLESFMRSIYFELAQEDDPNRKYGFVQIVRRLVEIGALSKTWYNSEKVQQVVKTRDKIVHGEMIGSDELDIVQDAKFILARLRGEVLDDFVFYVTQNHFKSFNVHRERNEFDFIAEKGSIKIFFEVKYYSRDETFANSATELSDKLSNIGFVSSSDSYYALFLFANGGPRSVKSEILRFHQAVKTLEDGNLDRIFIFDFNISLTEELTQGVKDSLSKILEHVNSVYN